MNNLNNNGNDPYNGNLNNYRSSENNQERGNGPNQNKKKRLNIKPEQQYKKQNKKSLSSIEKELEELEKEPANNKQVNNYIKLCALLKIIHRSYRVHSIHYTSYPNIRNCISIT